jgi:hypothetical protein
MTLTLQQFRRSFGKARRAAAAGTKVLVTDRAGASYVFQTATSAVTSAQEQKTFGEVFGHLAGSVRGGPPDLSSNKKHLDDFGRKSMGRR